ncbi:MAG: type II secretion system F family protein, partial [Planctomycetota bacterium]
QQQLIRVLKLCQDLRMDAVPWVQALANEHRGQQRERIIQFAKHLHAGQSIARAAEATAGLLAPHTVAAIRLGEATGTLAATYESILRSQQSIDRRLREGQAGLKGSGHYLFVMMIGLGVAAFISQMVWPTFRRMAEEFGLDVMPTSRLAEVLFDVSAIAIPIALSLTFYIAARQLLHWTGIHRPIRRPIRGWLSMLAMVISSGRPAPAAIDTLARFHHRPRIRRQFVKVNAKVQQGENPWDAMASVGLLSPLERDSLSLAGTPYGQSWLLNRFVNQHRSRHVVWAWLRHQGFSLFVLSLVSLLTGVISYSMFHFLSSLIQGLS